MALTLKELKAQALKLSIKERSELAHRLIVSLDGKPEGTPEEIACRVEEIDSGLVQLIPGEEVFAKIDAIIAEHEKLR